MPGNYEDRQVSILAKGLEQLFLDFAYGEFLDSLAFNIGLDRPSIGVGIDDQFRALTRKLAMTPHQVREAFVRLIELFIGPRRTKIGTLSYGEGSPAAVYGTIVGPFVITAGVNDLLYLSSNKYGAEYITLPNGAAVTSQQVVDTINASFLPVDAEVDSLGCVNIFSDVNVLGYDSELILYATASSAYATLGLTIGTYRGSDEIGVNNKTVKCDQLSYSGGGDFAQFGKKLIFDQYGPNQEIATYGFFDSVTRVFNLKYGLDYAHSKHLPYISSYLNSDAYAEDSQVNIIDSTNFPNPPADDYFSVIVNRGGDTEETVHVKSKSIVTGLHYLNFQDDIVLMYDHKTNESVELYLQGYEHPTNILGRHAAGSATIVVNNSYFFPAANFTVIVNRGFDTEEVFFISLNDPTTGTLTIDGTQQPDAPAVTVYDHMNSEFVEIAQLQVKWCGWEISDCRASGEFIIWIPACCLDDYRGPWWYLHEEIEPSTTPGTGIAATNVTSAVTVGDSELEIALVDTSQLWGDGIVQRYEDRLLLFRSALLTDGVDSEEVEIVGLKEATWLRKKPRTYAYAMGTIASPYAIVLGVNDRLNIDANGDAAVNIVLDPILLSTQDDIVNAINLAAVSFHAFKGPIGVDIIALNTVSIFDSVLNLNVVATSAYATLGLTESVYRGNVEAEYYVGDRVLYVDDATVFSPGDSIILNRGMPNSEVVTVASIFGNNVIVIREVIGLVNRHCYEDYEFETVELTPSINLKLLSPVVNSYAAPTVEILRDPPFLYDPASFTNPVPPVNASNLQDGGFDLISGVAHNQQDGRYPGRYIANLVDNMPTKYFTELAASGFVGNTAWYFIPKPTLLVGCSTNYAGNVVTTWGGTIPVGTTAIAILDGTYWAPFPAVAPYDCNPIPYEVVLSKGSVNEEVVSIISKQAAQTVSVYPTYIDAAYAVWIFQLAHATTKTHESFDPTVGFVGDTAIARIESILVDDASWFSSDAEYIFMDFGWNSQELVEITSIDTSTNVITIDGYKEFDFQHPVTNGPYDADLEPEFSGIPNTVKSVMIANVAGNFGPDGYDYPPYLPNLGTSAIFGGIEGRALVEFIRAAGIKVNILSD